MLGKGGMVLDDPNVGSDINRADDEQLQTLGKMDLGREFLAQLRHTFLVIMSFKGVGSLLE